MSKRETMQERTTRLAKGMRFLAWINPKKYKVETRVFNALVLYEEKFEDDVWEWRPIAETKARYSQEFKAMNNALLKRGKGPLIDDYRKAGPKDINCAQCRKSSPIDEPRTYLCVKHLRHMDIEISSCKVKAEMTCDQASLTSTYSAKEI